MCVRACVRACVRVYERERERERERENFLKGKRGGLGAYEVEMCHVQGAHRNEGEKDSNPHKRIAQCLDARAVIQVYVECPLVHGRHNQNNCKTQPNTAKRESKRGGSQVCMR